jgi:anti-anti-sigma factor
MRWLMDLTLLPLQNDNVLRVRTEGAVSCRRQDDPLLALLGPHCYGHKVLLNLERSPSIDTSGVCWLMDSQKRFAQAGGKLVMCCVTPLVLDVLSFLRLTPLLSIAAHEDAASKMLADSDRDSIAAERPGEPAIRFPR